MYSLPHLEAKGLQVPHADRDDLKVGRAKRRSYVRGLWELVVHRAFRHELRDEEDRTPSYPVHPAIRSDPSTHTFVRRREAERRKGCDGQTRGEGGPGACIFSFMWPSKACYVRGGKAQAYVLYEFTASTTLYL